MIEQQDKTDLCEDSFAIVLGAGQACVEVTGLLDRLRWIISYKMTQSKNGRVTVFKLQIVLLAASHTFNDSDRFYDKEI